MLVNRDHLSDCPFLKQWDLDPNNKQNWDGCGRMFSLKVHDCVVRKVGGYKCVGAPTLLQRMESTPETGLEMRRGDLGIMSLKCQGKHGNVAILVDAGGRLMWQVGNMGQTGHLKKLPRKVTQESTFKNSSSLATCPHPAPVSVHDEKAVFVVRLHRECDDSGGILDASMNHDECIGNEPHMFHLSIHDSSIGR